MEDFGTVPWGAAADTSYAAVALTDAEGVVIGWGPESRVPLGLSRTEIEGRPVQDLLRRDDAATLQRVLARQASWRGRLAFLRNDGQVLELVLRAQPMPSGRGELRWILTMTRPGEPMGSEGDQTLADRAFTQCPVVQVIYDTELRFARVNAAAGRRFAATEEELRGRLVSDVFSAPVYAAFQRHLRQVIETGEPVHYEGYYSVPGVIHERPWAHEIGPVRDASGRLCGAIVTTYESSEQYWGRRRWSLLNEAATRIGTSLDVSQTAQELAETITPQLADFVTVDLLDSVLQGTDPALRHDHSPLALRRVAQSSTTEGSPEAAVAVGESTAQTADSPYTRCLATGGAILARAGDLAWERWLANDSVRRARVQEFGFHSTLAVPLRSRGTTLGVLSLLRRLHPEHPFDRDDAVLVEELAARAAVSIDNALRYTREHATALTLQHNLLPQRLREQPAVEFASRYLPADSPLGVGGDWFDVIPLSGARVALVVGDVVGHGLQASATMGRLRAAVRTLADVDLGPDELLTRLDDLVIRLSVDSEGVSGQGIDGDVGATCMYAVYDPVSLHCSIARAGHPLPAIVLPDATVEFPEIPAGPPLGLGSLPFECAEFDLPAGSLLALYTDGLIESRAHDISVGLDTLREALGASHRSLESKCDAIMDALVPKAPDDDVALLLARTRAFDGDHVATWDLASDPVAVAPTRADARRQLTAWRLSDLAFTTELVVSELVTNAIRYGTPPIRLRLIRDSALVIEVTDGSSTAPHLRHARAFDEGGRGLLLVAQMAQRWGTRHTNSGKTIWAELPLSQ
ncbi:SpoIIE family protein phosphatase [Streptomyces sp. NPDC013978]|nr:SpoIIE family protein phosphatase [Streptomyces caniscabiei]MBE4737607.1 SpoIIE family protein phosphatase [Streptomyces caniscabiei]MBE4756367.1 SpoIIE family protein phosphatase [Streptomyces caniscabiei]MBE4769617.1 SpoIIE family protein phosphatase [Streptomyces caniscabiei]MBE4787438.1 SpoIIE family protein phosphatase [Streptomyces caniscabiei]MBE4795157.1 SpoIIE family protein phosphatase [Streptomyces caniscabiei]